MAVKLALKTSEIRNIKPPVEISLIRLAPRTLDDDNLVSAFKSCRDACADFFIPGLKAGRADDSKSLRFKYGQEKSKEYAIKISVVPF